MAEQIQASRLLKRNENMAENWRHWKKAFELYCMCECLHKER